MGINIIAHAVMLISCENSMEKVKQFIDYDTISGLIAYDVEIIRSDENDSSMLEFPKGFVVYIFDGDTTPTAKISGDYGVNYERRELMMARHNVVVENTETQELLETESLYWDQKNQRLYTGSMVKISSPDKIVFGDSMTANESFTRREIFGIRATIEIDEDE